MKFHDDVSFVFVMINDAADVVAKIESRYKLTQYL